MSRASEGWIQTRTYTKKNGKVSTTYIARITPPGMTELSKSFTKLGRIDEPGTAKNWLDIQRENIRKGTLVDPRERKWTLNEWCEHWLASLSVGPRTYDSYRDLIENDVKPTSLGEMSIASITDHDLKTWYKALTTDRSWSDYGNLAASSALTRRTILASVFLSAVDADVLVKTPMRKVKTQRKLTQIKPIVIHDIPTKAEVWKLHKAATTRNSHLSEAILVSAGTGLRPGELFGLSQEHLIRDKKGTITEIHVTRQLVLKAAGTVFDLPKTESSVRRIPVGAEVNAAINRHLDTHPLNLDLPNGDVIFRAATGRPWTSTNYAYHWDRIRVAAGLDDMIYYRFRHYYISALINGGASPKLVMERAGHTSAEYTLRRYARLWPTDDLLTAQLSDFALQRETDGRNEDDGNEEDEDYE